MHPTRRNRRKPKQPSRERAGVPVVLRLFPTDGLSVRLSSGTRQFLSTNRDEGCAHRSVPEHRSKRPYNTFPSSSCYTSRRSALADGSGYGSADTFLFSRAAKHGHRLLGRLFPLIRVINRSTFQAELNDCRTADLEVYELPPGPEEAR